jgi:hypothetical protein
MAGPREVPELKILERSPSTLRTSMVGPQEVPELVNWEHSAFRARPSGRAVNGCRILGTNAQRVCLRHVALFLWSTAHRGPRDTWQHRRSPLRKAGPRAVGHVTAPELTSVRRRGPGPWDTWQRQSSPQQGGEIRS